MKKFVFVIVIVGAALFLTNPGMSDFQDFVRTNAADQIEQELGSGVLGELIGEAGSEFLADNASRAVERRSYLVCSLYTLDLDHDGRPDGRALGIAGQFVVIEEFGG